MLHQNKNVVIYGGGGVIGGAVARAFAAEGARLFLAGKTLPKVEAIAKDIVQAGGKASSAQVDALDAAAVEKHLEGIVKEAGPVDVVFNAIGVYHKQVVPLVELSPDDYMHPISTYLRSFFITSTAAARQMMKKKSGVILTLSSTATIMIDSVSGGFSVSCAATEVFSRQLALEVGKYGIRVVCLRPDGISETPSHGSHAKRVFGERAASMGVTLDEMLAEGAKHTLLGRGVQLTDVGNAAVFAASEKAAMITGTVFNLSGGSVTA